LLEKRLPEDPRSHRLLQNAVQGAQRGAALTQRLLAFSRRQELKPEAVDVLLLVSGMKELLERALGHGVELRTEFDGTLPPALVDANQLELALLNVALNARDAMPDGGTLTISAGKHSQSKDDTDTSLPPGDYVRIRIADNGIGMDEMTLAKPPNRFSPRRGPARERGSVCPWCMDSPRNPADSCASAVSPMWARLSSCACRWLRRQRRRPAAMFHRPSRRPTRGHARCSSSTMTCW
jgi:K+-sensing histidine kinase KdpD